jgi:hypothetical protein
VVANSDIANPQPTLATSAAPTFNVLTFEDNIITPIATRPGRHDAETPPKTPEQGPQTAGLTTPNGKVLLGQPLEDVGVSKENGKVREVAEGGIAAVSGSGAIAA